MGVRCGRGREREREREVVEDVVVCASPNVGMFVRLFDNGGDHTADICSGATAAKRRGGAPCYYFLTGDEKAPAVPRIRLEECLI